MRGLGLCTEGACITAGRGWTRSANPRGLLTKESQLHQGTCIQYMYMYMHVIHIQMYMYMSREQCRGFDSHVRYIAHWKMGSPGVIVLCCIVLLHVCCMYMYMYIVLVVQLQRNSHAVKSCIISSGQSNTDIRRPILISDRKCLSLLGLAAFHSVASKIYTKFKMHRRQVQ